MGAPSAANLSLAEPLVLHPLCQRSSAAVCTHGPDLAIGTVDQAAVGGIAQAVERYRLVSHGDSGWQRAAVRQLIERSAYNRILILRRAKIGGAQGLRGIGVQPANAF